MVARHRQQAAIEASGTAGQGLQRNVLESRSNPDEAVDPGGGQSRRQPDGGAVRLAGTLELAGLDLSMDQRRIGAMVRGAARYFVDDGSPAAVSGHWAGLRPCTPDGLPIVGAIEGMHNLIVATGHAMLGMTLGPVTGKLVAEVAGGSETSLDVAALSPDRFQRRVRRP